MASSLADFELIDMTGTESEGWLATALMFIVGGLYCYGLAGVVFGFLTWVDLATITVAVFVFGFIYFLADIQSEGLDSAVAAGTFLAFGTAAFMVAETSIAGRLALRLSRSSLGRHRTAPRRGP